MLEHSLGLWSRGRGWMRKYCRDLFVHESLEIGVVGFPAHSPCSSHGFPTDEIVEEVLPTGPLPKRELIFLLMKNQECPLQQREKHGMRHHLLLPFLVECK